MEAIMVSAVWLLGAISAFWSENSATVLVKPNIAAELGARLSTGAAMFLPGDSGWGNATIRWKTNAAPNYGALVEVASESDIQVTVSRLRTTV
jgi:hypothetical protein